MANESDLKYDGNQILLADHATDFGAAPATAANSLIIGTPTDVQMDLGGLADANSHQSAKFDFGDPRPSMYMLGACIEFASAPADNEILYFYLGGSPNATAGSGNPGGLSGVDGSWSTTVGVRNQVQQIGAMRMRNNTINIHSRIAVFRPDYRYGILSVFNSAGQAIATVADETHVVLTPLAYVPGA